MCGRFALYADLDEVTTHFSLTNSLVLTPRYNIAPSQVIPIIRKPGLVEFFTWGLRPKWLKEDQSAFINARMETLLEKPAFKNAFKQQRCLIIANGYYEWKQIGNRKQPYFICFPERKLFAFAGLYEAETCTIITKNAEQAALSQVHLRMPVILHPHQYKSWLDPNATIEQLQTCLNYNDVDTLQIFPVTNKMNHPKFDFVECIQPLQ